MYLQQITREFQHALGCLALVIFCFASAEVSASSYAVSIDTSALFGQSGQLVFEFIDGGPASNSVTLSGFATDGALGISSSSGGVSGSLISTLIMNDTDPLLNEYVAAISLGNHLHFTLATTENAPQLPDSSPDGFSFYILDALGASLTSTVDPAGLNALITLEIDEAGASITPYSGASPTVPITVTPVPIPPGALLFVSGLLGATFFRRYSVVA